MAHIKLVTEVPGPKSREMIARHEKFVARGLALGFSAFIREAKGAMLTDVDGNRFVDLAGGVGTMNVGHSDEGVLGAAREQLGRLVHTDYAVAPYGIYPEVAERLVGLIEGAGKAAFFNSGAEAVENSIKMARVHTGRQAVISFEGGFHGRTWMALSLTSKTTPYKSGIPAAMAFAMMTRSGSTPECSMANILPVRPKPVCTSSTIITMPCSSQSSLSLRR